ncbi:hypothetical protein TTHERM_000105129 (macronuclear) [Tetrahymena thermophila SB210]|uniref:Uncharacterized protein n=1 Tax=Tetrahymena thermophila (strain SB210) TaxID=312017 RepID=W7X7S0_TETTS|nr:hypothetical protein TTHERM_000105129 [Tetrahymena thermophila SB210]EWS75415.1 hypothetical protein TTHERM_000105129 [Tetrahymena thermophila SB210]|eukprot:XP_012652089.1 hypothetical protein TTHERM_000105129 [Tetrahymena thermophila SB210]
MIDADYAVKRLKIIKGDSIRKLEGQNVRYYFDYQQIGRSQEKIQRIMNEIKLKVEAKDSRSGAKVN